MDTLKKILGKRTIEKIPPVGLQSLKKYCENNDDLKVQYNTRSKSLGKLNELIVASVYMSYLPIINFRNPLHFTIFFVTAYIWLDLKCFV